jgi:hypothetical protein
MSLRQERGKTLRRPKAFASPETGLMSSSGYLRGGRIGLCAYADGSPVPSDDPAKGAWAHSLKLTSMPVEPLASTSPQSKESICAEGEQYDGAQPIYGRV